MYEKPIDEGELKRFGLSTADYAHEQLIVWHEHAQVYNVFCSMATQWRTGMSGATGLDYNVLPEMWRRLKVPLNERNDVFADLQTMEFAALKQMLNNRAN